MTPLCWLSGIPQLSYWIIRTTFHGVLSFVYRIEVPRLLVARFAVHGIEKKLPAGFFFFFFFLGGKSRRCWSRRLGVLG